MFQELSVPVKDIEWDKRVYYYHRGNNDSENVDSVRDCRKECQDELRPKDMTNEECLVEPRPGGNMRVEEVDAAGTRLFGADYSAADDERDRSMDWSRDGFGYMEFRRLSHASIASMALSPAAAAAAPHTPISLLDHNATTPRAIPEFTPSPSRPVFPPPTSAGSGRRSQHQQRRISQHIDRATPVQRPASMYTDFKQPLSRISESGGPDDAIDEDGDCMMAVDNVAVVDDTHIARASLREVARENRQLEEEIRLATEAVKALTRLVLKSTP
ncbi:hypothetical protein GGF44_001621 [Coemansia sp. RSA 1694]|nr:hypothetical protein GGF44_001621 [Coemansia sp. RSA 1694]